MQNVVTESPPFPCRRHPPPPQTGSQVRHLQDGGTSKTDLWGLKSLICGRDPDEWDFGGGQGHEGSSQGVIITVESPVKVAEAQKALKLLPVLRDRPGSNSGNLVRKWKPYPKKEMDKE